MTAKQMQSVKAMKKALIARIKALVKPHLYASGYVYHDRDGHIPVYAPKDGLWDAAYLDPCLYGGPDAVTDSGFVDSGAGGMIETPFGDVPLEDLITFVDILEKFDFENGRR